MTDPTEDDILEAVHFYFKNARMLGDVNRARALGQAYILLETILREGLERPAPLLEEEVIDLESRREQRRSTKPNGGA